ncbi:FCGR2 protein, partial [Chunga burmeisteri]|nr:FCGR2 protein [Chunga burmeisteri]
AGIPCHPAGAQPSQLMLDPPWTPMFLMERVTLTCQGSGAPGPTKWYLNERLWKQTEPNNIYVSRGHAAKDRYQCQSPGTYLSPAVTLSFSNDWLVLQVPTRVLLEGDELRLRCRG